MNIWVLFAGLAALFVGWALGPLVEILGQKVENSESARKSAEQSLKDSKYYSIVGIGYNNPEKEGGADMQYALKIIILFFIPFLLFIATGHSIFIKIAGIGLLLMFWKALISSTWGLIAGSKK